MQKQARINICHFRFILFNLKIFGEIITTGTIIICTNINQKLHAYNQSSFLVKKWLGLYPSLENTGRYRTLFRRSPAWKICHSGVASFSLWSFAWLFRDLFTWPIPFILPPIFQVWNSYFFLMQCDKSQYRITFFQKNFQKSGRPGARLVWLGGGGGGGGGVRGINNFGRAQKLFPRILEWRHQKKKRTSTRNVRILGWRQKKKVFIDKSAKKMVLAQEYWVDDQYFGGVRPRTAAHSSGTKPVTFFGTQSSLGGHISCLERHKQGFGWHGPEMPPRGTRPDVGAKQLEYAGW